MLKRELGVDARTVIGSRGEFSVWVDNRLIAKKGLFRFPPDKKILEGVQQAIRS